MIRQRAPTHRRKLVADYYLCSPPRSQPFGYQSAFEPWRKAHIYSRRARAPMKSQVGIICIHASSAQRARAFGLTPSAMHACAAECALRRTASFIKRGFMYIAHSEGFLTEIYIKENGCGWVKKM